MRHAMVLTVALTLATAVCSSEEPGAQLQGLGEITDVTIVVGEQPYIGDLIPPPTESGFRFRWAETGDVLTFRWSTLDKVQQRHIQKLFGIEVAGSGTHLLWGEQLDCVRLFLPGRKSVEGYEMPERALPGYRCLRTSTKVMHIPTHMVENEIRIQKRESEIFPAEQGLEMLLQRRPPSPDSPNDYLQLSRECAQMGLYAQAIDYLAIAETLDPRVPELTKDFRGELLTKHAETQAGKLYERIVRDRFRGEFASALEGCQTFLRNFPTSELRTKVEKMMPVVTENRRADLKKQVVFMHYTLVNDLIEKRMQKKIKIDAKGRPVAAIPGKQILTKENFLIRGTLAGEGPEGVKIRRGELVINVPRKSIRLMQDVDLSKGVKMVSPTFGELKAYCTDRQGGLGGDLVKCISERLNITPAEVRTIWNSRFKQTAEYRDGELIKSKLYVSKRAARYGKGSWLRDGVSQRRGNGGRRGGRNSGKQVRVHPEYSDNPETWWKVQYGETKFAVLKAMAAEKLFRVKELKHRPCPECGGTGVWGGTAGSRMRCPLCRGLRALTTVVYY